MFRIKYIRKKHDHRCVPIKIQQDMASNEPDIHLIEFLKHCTKH